MGNELYREIDAKLSQLEEKTNELKEASRQANEALRDLKVERKALETFVREQQEALNNQIVSHLRRELEDLGPAISRAVKDGEARVYKRFDELAEILMGTDKRQKKEPLTEVIRQWKEKNHL